jgi:4-amino-4-deoxy-L-arabinose transferase-like glycosyltransferase
MEWAAQIASIFVAIGRSAVSAAGYCGDTFRRPVLFAGVAMLICGLMLQFRLGRRTKT